jgi:hypothetical protein
MEVNGVGNNLFDVEGGGEVVNRNKKNKKKKKREFLYNH